MTRLLPISLMLLSLAALQSSPHASRPGQAAGVVAFGGGAGGGGGTPTPPIGLAPIAPTLDLLNDPFVVRVALIADGPRVIVLRTRDGRLVGVSRLTSGQPAALPLPPDGALLDILGTDVVGLPVAPGQQVTVVDG